MSARVGRFRRPRLPAAVAALLLAAGCGKDGDAPTAPVPDEKPQGIPTQLTDPDAVIASLAMAWEQMDHAAMDALLAPDFAFTIRDDEASDFPWLQGPSWNRDVELGFAANMFDPNFTGANPPVQSIRFDFTILSGSSPGTGTYSRTVDAHIVVLTGPNDGFSSDTRFILTMGTQPDGFLRVKDMQEVLKLEPGRSVAGVEQTTWGQIKNLYY